MTNWELIAGQPTDLTKKPLIQSVGPKKGGFHMKLSLTDVNEEDKGL